MLGGTISLSTSIHLPPNDDAHIDYAAFDTSTMLTYFAQRCQQKSYNGLAEQQLSRDNLAPMVNFDQTPRLRQRNLPQAVWLFVPPYADRDI